MAYYLSVEQNRKSVLLIDSRQPMSYTSAQSGDNYRNWWPHQTMTEFTNDSIDELERLARDSDNVFRMTRGGYVVATRRDDVANIVSAIPGDIDVDVISDDIATRFPALSPAIKNVIHIRRGGDISGQQLGQYMLQEYRAIGGKRISGAVLGITRDARYRLDIELPEGAQTVRADIIVNAAGPFAGHIARMLDVDLPMTNVYQQKIAFEDHRHAIPRNMPFSTDLDEKRLDWSDEERDLLAGDSELQWLVDEFPGGTHCRPDGGANGQWVKLGWAYNKAVSEPQEDMVNEPAIDESFPEIVIRGAAQLIPSLVPYITEPPTRISHYGGYYTMTDENWPLIGPLDKNGAFVIGALSGFGTMAACAAGKLCAAHICGTQLPSYANSLSLERFSDASLMAELASSSNKGLL